jgi:hypothetical protein
MGRPQPFRKPAQTTLDASGNGQATVTVPGGVWWKVSRTSVSTSITAATAVQPQVRLYYGNEINEAAFIEKTSLGNGASSDTPHTMNPGEAITASWLGGTPQAKATLTLAGEQFNL